MVEHAVPLTSWRTSWEVLVLQWKMHPWVAASTMLVGAFGGFLSIAVLDTINSAIHFGNSRERLLLPFATLTTLSLLAKVTADLLPAYAAKQIITELRQTLCRRILATPLSEIEQRGVPSVLALLIRDVPSLAQTLVILPKILIESMIVTIGLAYLAHLAWTVMVLTVLAIGLGLAVYLQFYSHGLHSAQQARDEFNVFNASTHALLSGIKELQLNSKRRRWFRRAVFGLSSKRLARADYVAQAWFSGGGAVQQISVLLLIGTLVFGGAILNLAEADTLTASVLVVMYLMGPIGMIVGTAPQLGVTAVAFERLAEFGLLSQQSHHSSEAAPEKAAQLNWSSIELQDASVTFGQPGATGYFQMGPVSTHFYPGERVFIVGDNGSGKSTLAKLLVGLYSADKGRIVLDGCTVGASNLHAYRELFSAIFSEFHLFDRIISSGDASTSRTLAAQYLTMLGLDQKVRITGDDYSTTTALSTGQRKRLALLCAYLEDRPIYVFDEWAADQDPNFKRFFYEVLLSDLKDRGKCVIVVTHDNQYFGLADRLLFMKAGCVDSDTQLAVAGRATRNRLHS
ncbi:MAG: cyclic peptide export ABC transporter [Pseudomonadota bacterium]|nr:cyclic peptide export ABC transporter [Pseudomonadota bacterium]